MTLSYSLGCSNIVVHVIKVTNGAVVIVGVLLYAWYRVDPHFTGPQRGLTWF